MVYSMAYYSTVYYGIVYFGIIYNNINTRLLRTMIALRPAALGLAALRAPASNERDAFSEPLRNQIDSEILLQNHRLLRVFWSLLDGIGGVLKGSWVGCWSKTRPKYPVGLN